MDASDDKVEKKQIKYLKFMERKVERKNKNERELKRGYVQSCHSMTMGEERLKRWKTEVRLEQPYVSLKKLLEVANVVRVVEDKWVRVRDGGAGVVEIEPIRVAVADMANA